MDENEELENNEQEINTNLSTKNASNQVTESVTKQIQKRLSNASVKNAAKQSLIKLLMPIITWVAIIIIILIIIIGIALFFITMPGMAIEKIKEFANEVGAVVASCFGIEIPAKVEEVEIYETLDYLENMGYDLKGYGFLSDFVGDTNDGVERNDDGNIINAESKFISTYLISDNYIYTIRNFTYNANSTIGALGAKIKSMFSFNPDKWKTGLITIRKDEGILGWKGEEYRKDERGYIKIDTTTKKMEIARGWFNNSVTYNLDGWTGRYGMPIDFLLSVHLATMMPDLSYDMANKFKTEVCILLHPIGGGSKDENTVIGFYKTPEGFVSYDKFHEAADSWAPFDAGRMSKKEAKDIMSKYKITSPDSCTGITDQEPDVVYTSTKDIKPLSDNNEENVQILYSNMIEKLKEYGYTGTLSETITFDEFYSCQEDFKIENIKATNQHGGDIPICKRYNFTETWIGEYEGEKCEYKADITYSYDNYCQYYYNSTYYSMNMGIQYNITRDFTQEEINKILEEYGANSLDELKCSEKIEKDSSIKKVCSECRKHIQKIYDKIKKTDVSHFETYQPYLSQVTDHWYRDVFFVSINSKQQFVDYDYEYEAMMKERWTEYETYTKEDGKDELIGEYKLYVLDEEGKYKEKNGECILFEGTEEEAAAKNIVVAKKAKTVIISDVYNDLGWNNINGIYSAYNVQNTSQGDFQPMYPDITEDDPDYEIKKNVYANVITTGNIVQTGEGLRTETNPKIKQMFLNNTYFRYDGAPKTAEIINKLRFKINEDGYYGNLKGENIDGKEVDYTDVKYEEDGVEYKVSDYSGQVSLNQDSLNAFSMLENEHTLDADYIYRDFKELIVELGYFEKEELTDETPRIMQWIIPDIGTAMGSGESKDNKTIGDNIVKSAEKVYEYATGHDYTYKNSSDTVGIIDISDSTGGVKMTMCSGFVTSVLVEAGVFERDKFIRENDKSWAPYAIEYWWFGQKDFGGSKNKTNKDGQKILDYMKEVFSEKMELVQDTSQKGIEINVAELQPGDILVSKHKLSDESDVTGHVAIYAGNGKIYHSTGGDGAPGVHYSNIRGAGGEGGWTRVIRVTNGANKIGSSGWPYRKIDKNEYESGTLIHSKGDMDVARRLTIKEIMDNQTYSSDAELGESFEEIPNDNSNSDNSNNEMSKNVDIVDSFSIASNNMVLKKSNGMLFDTVGSTQFKKENLIETAKACWEYIVENANYYTYAGASIPITGGSTVDCSSYASWVLYEYGFEDFEGGQRDTVAFLNTNWNELYGWEEIEVGSGENPYEQLQPGDFFVRNGEGTHHITFIVEKEDGKIYTFDCGGQKNWRGESTNNVERDGLLMLDASYFLTKVGKGKIIRVENFVQSNADPYEGYKGNEAVVSPVTGILLEYGTFDGNEKNEKTGEVYRTNVDLKYGIGYQMLPDTKEQNKIDDKTNGNTDVNVNDSQGNPKSNENQKGNEIKNDTKNSTGIIQVDKVGYAKIKVLDTENYKKLENALKKFVRWDDTFSHSNGEYDEIENLSEDLIKGENSDNNIPWNDAEKSLYGFKEFAESYSEFGIEGHTIYIDGFVCEKPDPEFNVESDGEDEIPKGEKIQYDDFGKNIDEIFNSDGMLNNEIELMESKYEKDDEYKFSSKKATDKINTESILKEQTISEIDFDGIKLIKEGTLLGRTMTDYELLQKRGKEKDYSKYRKTKDSENEFMGEIIGNYIRIKFMDEKKDVVENVEDYIKLDDGKVEERTQVEWDFYYWVPYESDGIGAKGEATHSGAGACGTVSGADEVAVGFAQWTCVRDKKWNNIPPLCEWLSKEDASLCGSLSSFSTYSNGAICDNLSSLQSAWWSVNDTNTDKFLELQMKYFYENDFKVAVEAKDLEWILEKDLVTQGTLASLMNYCPYPEAIGFPSWQSVIDESMSDKEIVIALLKNANPIKSTCGQLTPRWNAQAALACDILDSKFTDVENWVRTKEPSSEYGEGTHDGLIGMFRNYFTFDYNKIYKEGLLNYIGGKYEK